jgi:hypothetical protein
LLLETRYRFLGGLEEKDAQGWTFHNSIVFAYTLITTIGYGNVAPETVAGRVFCLFYGLVGVPLALLTIADIGMFLNKSIHQLATLLASTYKRYKVGFLGSI